MGTARITSDKETEEEGKKRGVSMEILSKAGIKENDAPTAYHYQIKIQ